MTMKPEDLLPLLPEIIIQARSALGNLRLAERQLISEEQRERDPALDKSAAVMDQSYYRLLRLVEHLESAISGESGVFSALRDRDLVTVAGDLCERAAGLTFPLEKTLRFVSSESELICAVDQPLLEDALLCLLSNAFTLTPKGGVITVELRKAQGQVLLSVRDGGSAIPSKQLDVLLQPGGGGAFPAPLREIGLNLQLCRSLAERQGGSLLAESHPGQGSCFTLSLPFRLSGELSEPSWDLSGGAGRLLIGLAGILPSESFRLRTQSNL